MGQPGRRRRTRRASPSSRGTGGLARCRPAGPATRRARRPRARHPGSGRRPTETSTRGTSRCARAAGRRGAGARAERSPCPLASRASRSSGTQPTSTSTTSAQPSGRGAGAARCRPDRVAHVRVDAELEQRVHRVRAALARSAQQQRRVRGAQRGCDLAGEAERRVAVAREHRPQELVDAGRVLRLDPAHQRGQLGSPSSRATAAGRRPAAARGRRAAGPAPGIARTRRAQQCLGVAPSAVQIDPAVHRRSPLHRPRSASRGGGRSLAAGISLPRWVRDPARGPGAPSCASAV